MAAPQLPVLKPTPLFLQYPCELTNLTSFEGTLWQSRPLKLPVALTTAGAAGALGAAAAGAAPATASATLRTHVSRTNRSHLMIRISWSQTFSVREWADDDRPRR